MTLVRISSSDGEPVSVLELKEYLRIDHDGEDTLLSRLISAAREDFERETNIILTKQVWKLVLSGWLGKKRVLLNLSPIQKVDSILFSSLSGVSKEVEPEQYVINLEKRPSQIEFNIKTLPKSGKITIQFTAGFETLKKEIPNDVRQALILLAAHWYEFRGGFFTEGRQAGYPLLYEKMVNSYRTRRIW